MFESLPVGGKSHQPDLDLGKDDAPRHFSLKFMVNLKDLFQIPKF
jgi:hypothetical protein